MKTLLQTSVLVLSLLSVAPPSSAETEEAHQHDVQQQTRHNESESHAAHEGHNESEGHAAHEGHSESESHAAHEGHNESEGHAAHEGHNESEDHAAHEGHDESEGHAAHEGHNESEGHAAHEGHNESEDHAAHEGHDESEGHAAHEGHDESEGHAAHEGHDESEGHAAHEGHDESEGHAAHEGHGEHEDSVIKLSREQLQIAGIVVESLGERALGTEIRAPGEIKLNNYQTVKVTTRITAQVVKRHVSLGDQVKKGQPLLTLSSVDMAEAQGALILADKEWRRVRKLGSKVVAERRYTEVRVTHQLAHAKVAAYGMTSQEITTLLKSGDASKANGDFQLLASRDGTIIQDDFTEGTVIEPGRVLLTITDETSLWVEARLTPQQLMDINDDTVARVQTASGWLSGAVTQSHHVLDEGTRTIAVRIIVENLDDRLHPGEFVEVFLQKKPLESVLAVPEAAVVRSPDGDWQVFIEAPAGQFNAQEVELGRSFGQWREIKGIPEGTKVVMAGAFFVASQLAKGGFDPHNH